MRYKIVEYANGTVEVMCALNHIRWDFQESYDGPDAWEDARNYVRLCVSELTVMREEIIDVQ